MKNKSELNVLYLSDNNYAAFAGVSITSLFENNKEIETLTVYIIDDDIDADNKKKFAELSSKFKREIVYLDMSAGKEKLKELNAPSYRGSYTTYLKLFAFDILPENVERIFFIDSDSVVVGNLLDLNDVDMGGYPICAVRDGLCHDYKVALGFDYNDYWFNMGIMLVDVNEWRKQHGQDKIVAQLKKRAAYSAVDQDLLNITQHGNIGIIHPKYNVTPHYIVYTYEDLMKAFPQGGFYDKQPITESLQNPSIYHFERFVGESPWHKHSVHPFTKIFDYYLSISPWKGYVKQKANVGKILKIEKFLYRILPKKIFVYFFAMGFKTYLKKCNKSFSQGNHNGNISL